jgi:GntR family transcriptional regulator
MAVSDMPAISVRTKLVNIIKDMDKAGKSKFRLPSEPVLAKNLGVSRSLLRRVLLSLEQEGVIERKKGVGTLVYPSILRTSTRLDSEMRFSALIAATGNTPKLVRSSCSWIPAGENCARLLDIDPTTEVAVIKTTLYSGETPAIYLMHHIPKGFFKRALDAGFIGSIFHLIRIFCEREIHHSIAWFSACKANAGVGQILGVKEGAPVLMWEEVFYDAKDEAVGISEDFFNTDVLPICMMRKLAGSTGMGYPGEI